MTLYVYDFIVRELFFIFLQILRLPQDDIMMLPYKLSAIHYAVVTGLIQGFAKSLIV